MQRSGESIKAWCARVVATLADKSATPEARAEALKDQAEHAKMLAKLEKETKAIYPHWFFAPNPPQARFLKMMDEGVRLRKHYDFAATFGTWTGKTACLGAIVAALANTHKGDCFSKLPLFVNWPFAKHIRIGCAPDQMNETTGAVWKALTDWMPRDKSWEAQKAGKHYPSVIKLPNGWTADVKTYDQAGEGKESADIGAYLFDEPPPLDDWNRAAGRRKHGGIRVIFGSFIDDNGEQPALFEDIIGDPTLEHFFAPTDQNLDDYSEVVPPFGKCVGYLPAVITREMMEKWPSHNADARRTGRPNILSAMVFKVEPDVHFVPRSRLPKELTVKLAFDPHDVRPGVIVVGGWDKGGALWIFDEWPSIKTHGMPYTQIQSDTLGTKQYSDLLRDISRKHGVRLKVIDSNFADTKYASDNGSTTLRRELWKHGGHQFVNGVKDVMSAAGGVARLRELLQVHDTPRGKRSKLYIVDDLHNCREGMTRLKRKRFKDELTGKVSDLLEDRWLDYPRCIMYLAMSAGTWRATQTQMPVKEPEYGHTHGADFERKMVEDARREREEAAEDMDVMVA